VHHRDVVFLRPLGGRTLVSTSVGGEAPGGGGGGAASPGAPQSSAIRIVRIDAEGDAPGGSVDGRAALANGCTIALQGKSGFLSSLDGKFRSPATDLASQWVVHATCLRRPRGGDTALEPPRFGGFRGALQELRIYRAPIGRIEAQELGSAKRAHE
jgi:hypothetical protein